MNKRLYAYIGVSTLVAIAAAFVIVQILFVWMLIHTGTAICPGVASCPIIFGMPKMLLLYIGLSALLVASVTSLAVFLFRTRKLYSEQNTDSENFKRIAAELMERLETGILVLDRTLRVVIANPACARILDLPVPSIVPGTPWSEIANPVLMPVSERIVDAVERGESLSREFRVFLPSGVRCVRMELAFFDTGAAGVHSVLFLTDNTREDEIKQKLVLQLEETHRHAVAKDNFFANMSHEIRTPINAILGMTYFAKSVAKEERVVGYIEKIESASDILLGIVNDILDFSKMQEHKFSLNPETFNLYGMRRILFDLFADKAAQRGLDFMIDFACSEDFYVYADQFRLTQVFMNLVSNAIKFTDVGMVHVTANVETLGTEVILRCAVRDTGCGLDEDEVSRLFTDFEQFGKVLVKNHEGTGLGLAITKRLVELMHGVIWVDSSVGKGSVFHFVVVLKHAIQQKPENESAELPHVELKSHRVLVVEDNEINAEIAGTLLAESGCTVEYAFDGVEAVELCRSRDVGYFDLVLMDIHMPRMNGYDAARALKKDIGVLCPVFAVTATSENTDQLEANRDVIAGYVPKPYNPLVFKAIFSASR